MVVAMVMARTAMADAPVGWKAGWAAMVGQLAVADVQATMEEVAMATETAADVLAAASVGAAVAEVLQAMAAMAAVLRAVVAAAMAEEGRVVRRPNTRRDRSGRAGQSL